MKLYSVSLEGFRGYKKSTKVLLNDLTVLIGKNDAGKTTVLEALDIFFNEGRGVVKFDGDDVNVDLKHCGENKKEYRTIIACEFVGLPKEIILDDSINTDLQSEYLLNEEGRLEIVRKYSFSGTVKTFIRALHPVVDGVNLMQIKQKELRELVDKYEIDCDKKCNSVMRKAIWQVLGAQNSLKVQEIEIDKDDAKKIWEKLQMHLPIYSLFRADRENKDSDDEVQDPLKTAVREILSNAEIQKQLEEIALQVSEKLREVSSGTLAKLKELDPNIANSLDPNIPESNRLKWADVFKNVSITGDGDIPINKRGSGVKRLILLSFFRAEAERRAHNSQCHNVIYSFEEPETSQHPVNQIKLIDAFKRLVESKSVQVFITTHSPRIVKELKFNDLRLIRHDGNGETVVEEISESSLSYVSLNEVNYIAFDEATEEYHDELYSFLEDKKLLNEYMKGRKQIRYIRVDKDGEKEMWRTKTQIIRDQIHHPENKRNPRFTKEELKQSIENMRAFIASVKKYE